MALGGVFPELALKTRCTNFKLWGVNLTAQPENTTKIKLENLDLFLHILGKFQAISTGVYLERQRERYVLRLILCRDVLERT